MLQQALHLFIEFFQPHAESSESAVLGRLPFGHQFKQFLVTCINCFVVIASGEKHIGIASKNKPRVEHFVTYVVPSIVTQLHARSTDK